MDHPKAANSLIEVKRRLIRPLKNAVKKRKKTLYQILDLGRIVGWAGAVG